MTSPRLASRDASLLAAEKRTLGIGDSILIVAVDPGLASIGVESSLHERASSSKTGGLGESCSGGNLVESSCEI